MARRALALAISAIALALAPAGAAHAAGPPPLAARAAALIDESTGQELYANDADAQLPIASTTKLMTALVTLRHARLSQVFAAPAYYPAPAESQIGLEPGERMNVHDLLIAMLLPSANDAADDLAYNVGHGSVARFVGMMNARARALGLNRTHYTTPIGLDAPGNYSSAHDLVVLARYVLRTQPFFRSVVRLRRAVLRTGDHVRVVSNLNDLVVRYSWIDGVKTGHTLDAGYVLVASGTKRGMTLIAAVLGTPSEAARDSAALALLNYGFSTFRRFTPVRAGEVLARVAIKGNPNAHVPLVAASTYTHVFPRTTRVRVRISAPALLAGPLPRHDAVGSARIVAGGRVVARIPLQLAHALAQIRRPARHASALAVSVTLSGLVLAAGAAVGLTMFWRERTRG